MSEWIKPTDDPFQIFKTWYEQARDLEHFEPTKTTLATVDEQGMPSARVVLLKQYDTRGFCFFTNFESPKSQELEQGGKAALVFHWQNPHHRQVRVRGIVEKMTYDESDNYFQTRGRGSQIGAWASPQSQEISSREELEALVKEVEQRFPKDQKIPCPENWGGFRVRPLSMEFWQSGEDRLHDRMKFVRPVLDSGWKSSRLAP